MNSLALPRPRQFPLPGTPRGAAFGKIVLNEARLARRQPLPIIGSIGLPVILMIIFGEIPSSHQVVSTLGGLTLFDTYLPIIMVLGLTMLTLLGLPSRWSPTARSASCAGCPPPRYRRPGCSPRKSRSSWASRWPAC